jgi:hypothetical protein
METRELFMIQAEHDYCMWEMNSLISKLNIDSPKQMNSPINLLIDNACGVNKIDWRDVALLVWWCSEIITRREKLNIATQGINTLMNGLIGFMEKSGKDDFLRTMLDDINNGKI